MNKRIPSSTTREKTAGGPEDAISGLVERVTFHNAENGFCVLKVKVENHRDLIAVLGTLPAVAPGEWITAQGTWERDREHGLQMKARTLKTQPPTSLEGIEKYLGSGLIKGIGPVYATKLVNKFGETVFDIIEHQSKRLEEVEGIGTERRKRIKEAWAEQKIVRDIMLFLHAHGLSTNRAARIYKTYGEGAIETIRANPYTLARDIHGIGFHSADAVASKLGFEPDSLLRARGAIDHLLTEATGEGHCALPREELIQGAMQLLEVNEEVVTGALERHLHDAHVSLEKIYGKELVFLPHLRVAEEIIARQLHRLADADAPSPFIDPEKAIPWVEEKTKRILSESQRKALATALQHRVVVITGGPGVGKTTLVQSLLTILRAKKLRCLLAAPTGRAAQRLATATGLEAKTLHRLLEFLPAKGTFARTIDNPLEADAVVVDEISMVDVPLMSRLLLAHPPEARLILVGDADQLPSVGPGLVLPDIIRSGLIQVVPLTEIFRQAQGSQIIQAAHAINQGILPDLTNTNESADFFFLEREDPEQTVMALITMIRERIPKRYGLDPIDDVQVLCPMHRGSLGIQELNLRLQEALNPKRPDRMEHQAYGLLFREGDKIIQTSNNYDKEVFNGDIGRILSIDHSEKTMKVRFEERRVTYDFSELDEVTLAYAITIHKSQGSEFPVVVMPLAMQQYLLLQRNLLYTGVTRGRKLVLLLGQRKALITATHNASTRYRHSGLLSRLGYSFQ
ncbi:MAG: ATP-dependent RecD-like DNA helicase [Chthoniobacterales bacterium]